MSQIDLSFDTTFWVQVDLEADSAQVVVTVSTAFEDHDEARRWLPQLDELALSLTSTP